MTSFTHVILTNGTLTYVPVFENTGLPHSIEGQNSEKSRDRHFGIRNSLAVSQANYWVEYQNGHNYLIFQASYSTEIKSFKNIVSSCSPSRPLSSVTSRKVEFQRPRSEMTHLKSKMSPKTLHR